VYLTAFDISDFIVFFFLNGAVYYNIHGVSDSL